MCRDHARRGSCEPHIAPLPASPARGGGATSGSTAPLAPYPASNDSAASPLLIICRIKPGITEPLR